MARRVALVAAAGCGSPPTAGVGDAALAELTSELATLKARLAVLPCGPGEEIRADTKGALTCVTAPPVVSPASLADGDPSTTPVGWDDLQNVPPAAADGDDDSLVALPCEADEILVSTRPGAWSCTPKQRAADFAVANTRCRANTVMIGLERGQVRCASTVSVDGMDILDAGGRSRLGGLAVSDEGTGRVFARRLNANTLGTVGDGAGSYHGVADAAQFIDVSGEVGLGIFPTSRGAETLALITVMGAIAATTAGEPDTVPFRITAVYDPQGRDVPILRHVRADDPSRPAPTLAVSWYCSEPHLVHRDPSQSCAGLSGYGVRVLFPLEPGVPGQPATHSAPSPFRWNVLALEPSDGSWKGVVEG